MKPFAARVTQEHLEELRRHSIYFGRTKQQSWLKVGTELKFVCPIFVEPFCALRKSGSLFSMGSFGFSRSAFPQNTTIGRYCSIASGVKVMEVDHPISRATTASFSYGSRQPWFHDAVASNGRFEVQPIPPRRTEVAVGNDVWIGSEVLLSRKINVGHGAVLAARALVTKDVPPYAIVGGTPARVIRYRFPENVIEKLLASRWWEFAFPAFNGLRFDEPLEFVDEVLEREDRGLIRRLPYGGIPIHEIFASTSDQIEDVELSEEDDN